MGLAICTRVCFYGKRHKNALEFFHFGRVAFLTHTWTNCILQLSNFATILHPHVQNATCVVTQSDVKNKEWNNWKWKRWRKEATTWLSTKITYPIIRSHRRTSFRLLAPFLFSRTVTTAPTLALVATIWSCSA